MKNFYTYILISLMFFAGCCKDIPTPEFTAEELALMPYKEGDTLKMKGANGRFLWLKFTKRGVSSGKDRKNRQAFLNGCPDYGYSRIWLESHKVFDNSSIYQTHYDSTKIDISRLIEGLDFEMYKADSLSFKISSYGGSEVFDLSKAIVLDTAINNQKLTLYKYKGYYQYSSSKVYFDFYYSKINGIVRVNFYTLKGNNYETY